jgi:four helix bundle protein
MGNSYRDLEVWQLAIELVEDVYRVTEGFPKHELYGLTAQVRKAAVSVPSNIAEGQGRTTSRDFHSFLGHARGSLMEVATQLIIAARLGYVDEARVNPLLAVSTRIKQMLYRLMQSISEAPAPQRAANTSNGRRETGNGERL